MMDLFIYIVEVLFYLTLALIVILLIRRNRARNKVEERFHELDSLYLQIKSIKMGWEVLLSQVWGRVERTSNISQSYIRNSKLIQTHLNEEMKRVKSIIAFREEEIKAQKRNLKDLKRNLKERLGNDITSKRSRRPKDLSIRPDNGAPGREHKGARLITKEQTTNAYHYVKKRPAKISRWRPTEIKSPSKPPKK